MSHHKKHHARHHHWVDGVLKTVEHFFDTIEEAVAHAKNSDAHTIKVYDANGELVHSALSSITPEELSTYA